MTMLPLCVCLLAHPMKPSCSIEQTKQLNPKIPPASAPHPEPSEYICLVRAVFKNEKISTVVHSKEVNKFQLAYCNLLKSNMDGLKRQKKQKTKKATQ